MHKKSICHILFLTLICSSGFANGAPDSVKDVVEGDDVVLQCRFSPALADSSATLYWIRWWFVWFLPLPLLPSVLVLILCLARNINDQHDNVAIGEKPFSTGYTWVTQPELGFVLTNSCHQLTPTVIFCQPWNESQTAFFFAFDEVSSLQLRPHHFYPPCWWLTLKSIFASLLISLFLGDEGKWREE